MNASAGIMPGLKTNASGLIKGGSVIIGSNISSAPVTDIHSPLTGPASVPRGGLFPLERVLSIERHPSSSGVRLQSRSDSMTEEK